MKKKNNFNQSPVFGRIFRWDRHKLLSLAAVAGYLCSEIYFARPLTARHISGAVWMVVYTTVFPLLWIWFAEYLEDLAGEMVWLEKLGVSLESVIRFFGWLILLVLLVVSLAKFWMPAE